MSSSNTYLGGRLICDMLAPRSFVCQKHGIYSRPIAFSSDLRFPSRSSPKRSPQNINNLFVPNWSVASPCLGATRTVTSKRAIQTPQASPTGSPEAIHVANGSVSVVLLAGGVGKRMGASIPKQYLKLKGQEIATYSMETFARMKEVAEIVIVCDPSWRDVFERRMPGLPKHVAFKWALPGAERQVAHRPPVQTTTDTLYASCTRKQSHHVPHHELCNAHHYCSHYGHHLPNGIGSLQ